MIIARLDTSSYFSPDYLKREAELLYALGPQVETVLVGHQALEKSFTQKGARPWVAITNSQTNLELIDPVSLQHLKLIVHPNSGHDNFTPDFVNRCPCPILLGHEIRAQAVAEVALTTLLERSCPVPDQKQWSSTREFKRTLLSEQKALLVGYGHVGQRLEKMLRPLVKKLSIYDPFKDYFQLDLLESSIIILAASLNPTSYHFINKAFFQQLPKGFTLINPARGSLIVEHDLLEALEQDPRAYAYLDVYEQEPTDLARFSALRDRGQIKTSSHLAGVYGGLEDSMLSFLQTNMTQFLNLNSHDFLKATQERDLRFRRHSDFLI